MKIFWHGVGVWFLIQLVIVSIFGNSNSVQQMDMTQEQVIATCEEDLSPAIAGISGLIFPVLMFDFINADFCWNIKDFNQ